MTVSMRVRCDLERSETTLRREAERGHKIEEKVIPLQSGLRSGKSGLTRVASKGHEHKSERNNRHNVEDPGKVGVGQVQRE